MQLGSDSESEDDVVRDMPSPSASGTNRRKIKDSVKANRNSHLDHKKPDKQLSKLNSKRAESKT